MSDSRKTPSDLRTISEFCLVSRAACFHEFFGNLVILAGEALVDLWCGRSWLLLLSLPSSSLGICTFVRLVLPVLQYLDYFIWLGDGVGFAWHLAASHLHKLRLIFWDIISDEPSPFGYHGGLECRHSVSLLSTPFSYIVHLSAMLVHIYLYLKFVGSYSTGRTYACNLWVFVNVP